MPEVLARSGVRFDGVLDAGRRLASAAAYLELHIEQGPVLESMGLPLGVVTGTFAAERHEVTFRGQAAHAGSTPMHLRRDALAGAARLALAARESRAPRAAWAPPAGSRRSPASPLVPGVCALTLDLRHASAAALERMLRGATRRAGASPARASPSIGGDCGASIRSRSIPPLVALAEASAHEVSGGCTAWRADLSTTRPRWREPGMPTVMLFVQSLRGLSPHARRGHSARAPRALGAGARPAGPSGPWSGSRPRTCWVARFWTRYFRRRGQHWPSGALT